LPIYSDKAFDKIAPFISLGISGFFPVGDLH